MKYLLTGVAVGALSAVLHLAVLRGARQEAANIGYVEGSKFAFQVGHDVGRSLGWCELALEVWPCPEGMAAEDYEELIIDRFQQWDRGEWEVPVWAPPGGAK